MVAGALVLVGFVAWERVVARRRRRPLVDLTLFGSRGFTWGTILATIVSFAMFGLLFTVPTYYQAIVGVDPLGAGVRLLPMVGGLVVGAALSDRLARPDRRQAHSRLGLRAARRRAASWALSRR